jgi:WD40 repeat protein
LEGKAVMKVIRSLLDLRTRLGPALCVCLLAATIPWLLCSGLPRARAFEPGFVGPTEKPNQSRAESASGILLDIFGDPLPRRAVARIGTLRFQHGCPVADVCYSSDGRLLASVGGDGTSRIWDVATGKELRRFAETFGTVAFSPDSSNLITGGERVRVWDIPSGRMLYSLPFSATSLALSTDGKNLAVKSEDGFHLWDMITGKETGHASGPRGVFAMAFAPDAKKVAVGGEKDVRLIDLTGGKETLLFAVKGESVRSLSFSPDGKTLAVCNAKGGTVLWDVVNRRERFRLSTEGAGSYGYFVKYAPDGEQIAMAGTFAPLKIWEVRPGQRFRNCATAPDMFTCVAFAPDSRTLVVAGEYGRIQIIDSFKGVTRMPFVPPPDVGGNVVFRADRKSVLTTTRFDDSVQGGSACVWDATTGKDLSNFQCYEYSGHIESSADGCILAAHVMPSDLWLFNVATGEMKSKLAGEHGGWTHSISGDGKRVATTGPEGHVISVWDVASGKELRRIEKHPWLTRMLLSPDGNTLAAASLNVGVDDSDGTIRVWDVATGRELWKRAGARSQAFAFSPDGNLIATSGQSPVAEGEMRLSGEVRLWEAKTGREIWIADAHSLPVYAFAFTPDCRTLATGGDDGDVRLWEVASGRERLVFRAHDTGVTSASFSPDGGRLVTAGCDRTALVWNLIDSPARLSTEEANTEWKHLKSNDAKEAYIAVRRLSGDPERAVGMLRARLRTTPAPDSGRVAMLIADLDNDVFSVRERAESELTSFGEAILPTLRKLLTPHVHAEAARRLRRLIEQAEGWPPERLQEWRALEILENIGSKDAKDVLLALAGGLPHARSTDGAKAALSRLGSPRVTK